MTGHHRKFGPILLWIGELRISDDNGLIWTHCQLDKLEQKFLKLINNFWSEFRAKFVTCEPYLKGYLHVVYSRRGNNPHYSVPTDIKVHNI